jgi:hypothetical protein
MQIPPRQKLFFESLSGSRLELVYGVVHDRLARAFHRLRSCTTTASWTASSASGRWI